MRVKFVLENKLKRRLTYQKDYEVIDKLVIIKSINGIDKKITYIQIIDDIGVKINCAMQYNDIIWFKDTLEIRNEVIENIIKN